MICQTLYDITVVKDAPSKPTLLSPRIYCGISVNGRRPRNKCGVTSDG